MEKRSIFSSGSYSLKLRGVNRMCFSFWGRGEGCVRVENILWSGKFGDFDRGWFL